MSPKLPSDAALPIVEKIALLSLLNRTPTSPGDNPRQPSNSSPDSSRKLSFDCEACLTSTLAFLSGISDDPGHVVAVCVEELVGFNGLRVLVAINKKNHESGIGVLKRIEEGLERIFGYLSRANKATEQNAVPVETQVLTAILDMSERRILSRIRSKRFESRYSKKDKWAFSIVVRDVLSVAEKTRGTKRVSPESKSFIDSTTNLAKLLDQLETCPLKDLRDCLKAIVEAASGLTDNTNFDSIFPGATSLQLTAATKLDFISRLKKLARYYECPNFLIQLAKRSGLFEKATIMTVALDAKYFTRCAAGPAGSSLAGCLDRCQSGPSPPFGVKGISRRLGKNQTQANTAFNEAVTEALSESKIHAEVQIVAFYELHPVPRMPRVICSSKDACYLCNQFVKLHGMFHVPRTHGNLYTRWKVPAVPSLSPLRDSFGDSLQGQIRKAIQEFQVDHERKFVFTKHENESSIFPFEQLMSSLDSIPIPPIDSPSKIVTKKAKGKKAKKRSKNAPVPPSHEVEQPKLMPSPPSLAQEQPEQSNTPAGVPETTTKPVSHHPELPDKQQGQPKQILQQLKSPHEHVQPGSSSNLPANSSVAPSRPLNKQDVEILDPIEEAPEPEPDLPQAEPEPNLVTAAPLNQGLEPEPEPQPAPAASSDLEAILISEYNKGQAPESTHSRSSSPEPGTSHETRKHEQPGSLHSPLSTPRSRSHSSPTRHSPSPPPPITPSPTQQPPPHPHSNSALPSPTPLPALPPRSQLTYPPHLPSIPPPSSSPRSPSRSPPPSPNTNRIMLRPNQTIRIRPSHPSPSHIILPCYSIGSLDIYPEIFFNTGPPSPSPRTEPVSEIRIHYLDQRRAEAMYVARPRGFIRVDSHTNGVDLDTLGSGDAIYLAHKGDVVMVEIVRRKKGQNST